MQFLVEEYIKLQISDLNTIKRATCQFVVDEFDYKSVGSGVFIKIKNSHFLVSAAHVMDKLGEIAVPISNGKFLLKPGGNSIINNFGGSREEDKLDIAILKLDEKSVEELSESYAFIDECDILLNHKFVNLPIYTFFGYPSSLSNTTFCKKKFQVYSFFHFSTPGEKSLYERFGLNDYQNVIASYDKKKSYSQKSKLFSNGPDLYGISGCGLWMSDPINIYKKQSNPKLVAIMTDWLLKDKRFVVGTRVDLITEAIRTKFNVDTVKSEIVSYK